MEHSNKSQIRKLIETRSHSKLRVQQENENIIPQLLQLMEDKDKEIRANAAFACAQLAKDFPEAVRRAVPKLTYLLADKDKYVTQNACSALGEIGEVAPEETKQSIPSLIRLLDDPSVQEMASFAIGRIGSEIPQETREAVPKLARLLDSEDPNVRQNVCEALAKMSEKWPEGIRDLVPKLVKLLDDRPLDSLWYVQPGICGYAACALGKIGKTYPGDVKEAIPKLTELTKLPEDELEFIRENAVNALAEIEKEHPDTVKAAAPSSKPQFDDEEAKSTREQEALERKMANNEAVQCLKLADSYLAEFEKTITPNELNESDGRELLNTVDLAMKQIDKAERIDPTAQLYGIGITLFRARAFGDRGIIENNALGRRSAAILSLKKSIELCDHIPDAHYNIGLIYSQTGKREDALRHLRRAVDLSPDDIEYRKTLDRAENVFRGLREKRTILWSWIIAGIFGCIAAAIVLPAGKEISTLGKVVFFLFITYLGWSWYWGRIFILDRWGEKIERYTSGEHGWILGLILLFFVFPNVGFYGGGIYQYLKYRKILRSAAHAPTAKYDTGANE